MKNKYSYFVSYQGAGDEFHGFGNIEILRPKKIISFNDIVEIKTDIEKFFKTQNEKEFKNINLVILNYILLNKIKKKENKC